MGWKSSPKTSTFDPNNFDKSKLGPNDFRIMEEMRKNKELFDRQQLHTIDEEKSKLVRSQQNQNRFMKTNKLAPFDDRPEDSNVNRLNRNSEKELSWAITGLNEYL